jgi:hypothetical protein
MLKKITALLFISIVSSNAQAAGVDLRLADKTAELVYLTESSTFGYGGADVGLGFFYNEADDFMLSATIMVSGHSAGNNRPLQFGAGAKLLYASLDLPDESVSALAIGGQIRYLIPAGVPVAILAEAFVAPEIVTFSDADGVTEYRFAIELEVTPSARAYVGFRHIEVDLGAGDYEMDDDAHIGVRIEF